MIEAQLRLFPAFQSLPIYDEGDERADAITSGCGAPVRECLTMREVEECLATPGLVPLGGLRVESGGRPVVVAYFKEAT